MLQYLLMTLGKAVIVSRPCNRRFGLTSLFRSKPSQASEGHLSCSNGLQVHHEQGMPGQGIADSGIAMVFRQP